MRALILALTLLVAGCSAPVADEPASDSDAPDAMPPETREATSNRLPPDMNEEIAYFGAFEGAGAIVAEACAVQPWCFDFPFHVDEQAHMDAQLTWSVLANDLDLLLLRGGEVVARADQRGDAGPEALDLDLGPGDYVLRVVPYFAPDEPDAQMTAVFSPTSSS